MYFFNVSLTNNSLEVFDFNARSLANDKNLIGLLSNLTQHITLPDYVFTNIILPSIYYII